MAAMIPAAASLVADSRASVRRSTEKVYAYLVDEHDCQPYVKTIYIGFELGGELVAALYPHVDHIEIAMALPESATDPILTDAIHLTWKTLPVAAIVRTAGDTKRAVALLGDAVQAVSEGVHDVNRPNEHFRGRTRRLTHNPQRRTI